MGQKVNPYGFRLGANRENRGSAHGDRFRLWAGRIDGDDPAVPEDERGGFAGRCAWRATGGREGRDED